LAGRLLAVLEKRIDDSAVIATNRVRSPDGTAIAFDRSGDGPPVIVVAGALSTRWVAAPLAALLAPHFSVIAYDRRGRGDSGDTPPYAVEREIEDIEALIAEAGGSSFVYGHSSGAALALRAAANGVAIRKLAIYEPPFIVDDGRSPLTEVYSSRLVELLSAGHRGDAVELFMTEGVGAPAEVVAQMRSGPMWPAMEELAHTIAYDDMVMGDTLSGRPLPDEWASAVTVPTLVMDGGKSPPWMHHATRALADLLPHAELRTLEGQDHGAAPEAVAPILAAFFGD